ncbi:MAG: PBP1A family penicillin-binding protein [Acidobacteria bacterium]|nr:PBP1A family penicillin-binding protein [Acidobacteriota bacterium]
MLPGSLRTDPGRARALLWVFIVLASITTAWLGRQGYAVHKLTRGVGDTWFHTADGRPWFRLDEQRHDVPMAAISPHLQHAFVAVEDHRFFRHPGVDPIAVARAVYRNVREPGTVEGGSTITQQLARTLFLSNRKSYLRKAREAVLSVLIEAQLTKEQILELYLNRIYLSAGIYGVEAMSRRVFGKPARDLSIAESALIAGLARAPATLSPWSNLDGAIARSHVVLARMRDAGFITEAEEREARRARLRVRAYRSDGDARHGYAKAYLRQRFRDTFGGDHPPDWRVETTFVAALQDAAEGAVERGLSGFGKPELQAALVAMDPHTGDVLALVGGRDYQRSAFNRASLSRRQPGSAFKPIVFAVALERGLSPVSVLNGLDRIAPQGPDEWTPRNATDDTPDALTLRAALLESDNRAATLLQQRVGARRVLSLASRAGLDDLPDVPSLALGTGLVTPLAMTAAFAMFPNGGMAVRPRDLLRVIDADGAPALQQSVEAERVLSPEVAFQMVSMLGDVVDRGTGTAARRLGVRFPIAGKTGTTDDFKDAWFVGFSPSLVVGVWVGFDRPATIGRDAYGSRYALPIWADFMQRAVRVRPAGTFERPARLHEEALCAISYSRPVEGCPLYTEYFKEGDQVPDRLCTLHRGTIRQRVSRTVQGWIAEAGRRVRAIFR